MLRNPVARLIAYGVAYIALGTVTVLTARNIIDQNTANTIGTYIQLAGQVLGLGSISVAGITLGKQLGSGTFNVPGGSPAEQLAVAAKNYAEQRKADEAALDAVLSGIPGGHDIADAITGAATAVTGAAAEVVTACGDALK